MLNLSPIFNDAIEAIEECGDQLTIPPLPATIFMMQCDVINHYRFALNHYFPLTLNEHFLQNSSIGSPYEKWAFFTNKDFEILSFTIHNLIRFTSRLIHETQSKKLISDRKYAEVKQLSSDKGYVSVLCEMDYDRKMIGIHVSPNQTLTLTPFSRHPIFDGRLSETSTIGGESTYRKTTIDSSGIERTESITREESKELSAFLCGQDFDIHDRSTISQLRASGLAELDTLAEENAKFGKSCRSHCQWNPYTSFENILAEWLV